METLCGVSDYLVAKLQKIQNFAARIITGVTKYQHVTPALKELHWLPVRQRIKYKVLTLTYQMIHGLAPSYLCEMLTMYIPGRKLQSADICYCVHRNVELSLMAVNHSLVSPALRGTVCQKTSGRQNLYLVLNHP